MSFSLSSSCTYHRQQAVARSHCRLPGLKQRSLAVGSRPAAQHASDTTQQRAGATRPVAAASTGGSAVMASAGSNGKTKVLFVCLGNICRSPSAEAVFKSVVERAGVASQFEIDSCGTGGGSPNWYLPGGFSYHEGDPADPRMTAVARTRGVTLTSRSRPLSPGDLQEFDWIIGMDDSNLASIRRAANHWAKEGSAAVPADWESKLALMTDFLQDAKYKRYSEVPDPYYGGQRGFELVLDLLDDACQGLLDSITNGGTARRQGS